MLCTYSDNSRASGQHWHFVGSIVGPTLTNDVSSLVQLNTVGSMLVKHP